MVFSSGLTEEQFGTAFAVPFKSEDFVEEAEHLWAAERDATNRPNGGISAAWGCVGLLENPVAPAGPAARARTREETPMMDILSNNHTPRAEECVDASVPPPPSTQPGVRLGP